VAPETGNARLATAERRTGGTSRRCEVEDLPAAIHSQTAGGRVRVKGPNAKLCPMTPLSAALRGACGCAGGGDEVEAGHHSEDVPRRQRRNGRRPSPRRVDENHSRSVEAYIFDARHSAASVLQLIA